MLYSVCIRIRFFLSLFLSLSSAVLKTRSLLGKFHVKWAKIYERWVNGKNIGTFLKCKRVEFSELSQFLFCFLFFATFYTARVYLLNRRRGEKYVR